MITVIFWMDVCLTTRCVPFWAELEFLLMGVLTVTLRISDLWAGGETLGGTLGGRKEGNEERTSEASCRHCL